MVRKIVLSSGIECLVDAEDYEWLSETKWADDSRGYAIRRVRDGRNSTEKMHRLIIDAKPGEIVDHINGIPWDNRKENLRIVTVRENALNTKTYNTNKTGYRGVAVNNKPGKKYTAQITVNYKKLHLGMFDDPKEAAKAYNEAAIKHFGEFAKLNDVS